MLTKVEGTRVSMRLRIFYTNYRGEQKWYHIQVVAVYVGVCEWHKERQVLMDALDVSRNVMRTFAVNDIEEWSPEDE